MRRPSMTLDNAVLSGKSREVRLTRHWQKGKWDHGEHVAKTQIERVWGGGYCAKLYHQGWLLLSLFFFSVSALSIVKKTLVIVQRSLQLTGEGGESHGGFLQFTELVWRRTRTKIPVPCPVFDWSCLFSIVLPVYETAGINETILKNIESPGEKV